MDELNFTFKMPDDETLAKYISIKGEKGEKGDPTKLSQLDNDTGFVTASTDALTNYYTKTATDSNIATAITALDGELGVPEGFFTNASETVDGEGSLITLNDTANAVFKDIRIYGDTQQEDTPTPDNPVEVQVVTGDQIINISDDGQQSQSYTISLGDIELCKLGDYQDYIYKSGDSWYIHKETGKKTQDGTASVTYYNAPNAATAAQTDTAYFSISGYSGAKSGIDLKSDMFGTPYANANRIWGSSSDSVASFAKEGIAIDTSSLRLRLLKARMDDWDESLSASEKASLCKAWLNATTPTFYYALASAADEEITDKALIRQLDSLYAAHSYNRSTVLSVSGSLPAYLYVEAYNGNWNGTVAGLKNELANLADYDGVIDTKLAQKPYYFDSVEDMQAYDLKAGNMAITTGYYAYNDGGAGKYKIINSDLTADNGSVIDLTNGLQAILIVENDTVNVKQFGAKGDGTTNDSAAIANALKFRGNDYLKVKFNKSETYIASGTIYLYSNTEIDLDGATIKAPTELRMLTNEEAMAMTGYGVVKNISVRNGTFQGATGQVIFGLLHASNVKFEDINFLDCGRSTHTLDLGGCDHVLIRNCRFIGSYIAAADNYREVIQTDYATRGGLPYWEDASSPAYDGLPTTDVEVTGCTFEIGDGTHYPNAIGTHAVYGTVPIQRIRITNNIFKRFTFSAIRFLSIEGLVIDGNLFINDSTEATDQNIIAIRLVNDSLSTATYPTLYLKDIYISNNRFARTAGYIGMTAIDLAARTDCPAKGVFVNNNIYEGAWNTSSDGHDFLHMASVEDILIVENILREPKIAFYAAGTSAYFGTVIIRGNKIYAARDVYNATSGTLYPKNYTFENNVIEKDGVYMNSSRFHEQFTMSEDTTAAATEGKVIPFDTYNNALFAPNAQQKTLVPMFLHQFKAGGKISFESATSRDVVFKLNYWRVNAGGTKVMRQIRQYCEAGQRYEITLPEAFIDTSTLGKPTERDQVWLVVGVQSGDKIYSEGTELYINGY